MPKGKVEGIKEKKMATKLGYEVTVRNTCTKRKEPEEEYGFWMNHYENSLERIRRTKEAPDVVSDFNIKPGESCYVVWCEYDEGDSFGSSENGGVEIVGVFKDRENAIELRNAIIELNKQFHKQTGSDYRFYYKTSDGQEFVYGFCPWYGYFERLSQVNVDAVIMG